MKRIKQILKRILFPSKMKLICIPVVSFIILIFILTSQKSRTMPAYLIYCMSAYSLVIWLLAVPSLTKRIKSAIISNGIIQKITASPIIGKYLNDLAFRGNIIYLSALYTFYTMITAVVNVVKFRKLGSPILSAAKILNFISAMMSILGLQTAMISRFSENGDNYRKTMNAITGGFVYCIVIFVAVFMLICSRKNKKEGGNR